MAQRRFAPINAPMTEAAKAEDVTITGDWTFDGTPTFTGDAAGTSNGINLAADLPSIWFNDTGGTTDESDYKFYAADDNFYFYGTTDAGSSQLKIWQVINRVGVSSAEFQVTQPMSINCGATTTLELEATGDSTLYIKADTDNVTETDNQTLRMEQDGNTVQLVLGLSGETGKDSQGNTFTNASANGICLRNAYGSGTINIGVGSSVGLKFASNNTSTFYANVTIDTDGAGPMLQLSDSAGADGDVLLRFNTDRPWDFRQGGTGASTSLDFVSTNDGKWWNVKTQDLTTIFRVLASNSLSHVDVRSGSYFNIYDSTGNDYMNMYHNGTDFYMTGVGTTWIRKDVTTGELNLTGMEERWYSTDNLDSIRISHDGTYANINIGNQSSTQALKVSAATSDHLFPGIQVLVPQIAGDDATVTWNIENDGGIYWLVATSTSTTESQYINAWYWSTTAHTTISTNNATAYSLGTGSNPDVDGDHNIWFTNGGKTMNIKNRRGSSRYYNIYFMSGRA